MLVLFNDIEEYLVEVGKDRELVHDKIVRLAQMTRGTKVGPLFNLNLVATCIIRGHVIRLQRSFGQVFLVDGKAGDVQSAAQFLKIKQAAEHLEKSLVAMGLDVRGGIFNIPESHSD
jgi:hypothetical protein